MISARALSAMVGRMAHSVYVLGDDVEREALVQTLTRLWANALRLPDPGSDQGHQEVQDHQEALGRRKGLRAFEASM